MSRVEFDDYSDGYSAGMEHPIKRLLGGSREEYLLPKLRWIKRRLGQLATRYGSERSSLRVLEVGCADGLLLRELRRLGLNESLSGCDVSEQMIQRARSLGEPHESIDFQCAHGQSLPYADQSFDSVIVCSVLHHVPPLEQMDFLRECLRVIRRGGELLVVEHNPWNPITCFVVATTAIDRHAKLVSASNLRNLLRQVGCSGTETEYLMFFPPRLTALCSIESWIFWLPFGGQYALSCKKVE